MYRISRPGEPIELAPLVNEGDDEFAWSQRRYQIEETVRTCLGPEPKPADVKVEWGKEQTHQGCLLRPLTYATGDGDRVSAYLLMPKNRSRIRFPAVIAMHPTSPYGKDEVIGMTSQREWAYGLELAQSGYVVLAPDVFFAGERNPLGASDGYDTHDFYVAHPDWSAAGKMLHDHRQGLEVLLSLEDVDPGRIAAIGHSLGGTNAYWLLAMEPRLQAAVVSCGYATFAGDPNPTRWSRSDPLRWNRPKDESDAALTVADVYRGVMVPSLRPWLLQGLTPFEFHEILALAAPRPFFIWVPQQDEVFPHWSGAAASVPLVRAVFDVVGSQTQPVFAFGRGPHGFPRVIRRRSYRFLDRCLGR